MRSRSRSRLSSSSPPPSSSLLLLLLLLLLPPPAAPPLLLPLLNLPQRLARVRRHQLRQLPRLAEGQRAQASAQHSARSIPHSTIAEARRSAASTPAAPCLSRQRGGRLLLLLLLPLLLLPLRPPWPRWRRPREAAAAAESEEAGAEGGPHWRC